jgi:hypothetical protein
MKTRIETRIAEGGNIWYFPQYYTKPYFFRLFGGWKDFIEDKGIDPLGFAYPDGSVQFYCQEDAIDFLKSKEYKSEIVYENSK